ncbi:acyltransferase family protein, partial [Aquirufa sp.]|uniref:acyltransferase family protein n=1 Tax=Aquirufa sp. TaxID=2676249 RepID=UPI0037C083A8
MKYIPALDGVRALAILLVLIYHWYPEGEGINVMPNGPIGVTLFFVLSGYLISNILMEQQSLGTFARSFKNFVVRRALRIFPIYFLVLIGLLVLERFSVLVNTDFYTHPGYYWTYLVNYWIELHGNWSDALSPYWSLSVEEQFYLLWPFCMLLLATRLRAYFLWFTVVFGVVYRYFSVHVYGGLGVSMFSCVDTFAWGALLAHYLRAGQSAVLAVWIKRLIIPVGFCFLMLCLQHTDEDLIRQLFFRTFTSLVSVALLFYAMQPGIFSKVFSFKPFRLIGQMSYGLYLYHMVVPDLFYQIASRLGIAIPILPFQIIPIGVLSLSAYLSYRLIES